MAWWMWLTLGFALLVIEMLTPGVFALFFGVGALIVAALTGFGVGGPPWFQWVLFSVLSVASLALLRGRLAASLASRKQPVDTFVGERCVLVDDLPVRGVSKVELRGSQWNARSAGEAPLARGQRCQVERIEGLTLWIRPE